MSYNFYSIPKSNGKRRIIGVPDEDCMKKSEKLVKVFNSILSKSLFYRNNPCIHSYCEGKSSTTLVQEIISFIKDYEHFEIVALDVKDYFGSINKSNWNLAVPYNISADLVNEAWDIVVNPTSNQGIVQGNPLSPIISNIVGAWAFDTPLQYFIDLYNAPIKYFRYSDNIFLVIGLNENVTYKREDFLHQLNVFIDNNIPNNYKFKFQIIKDWQEVEILGIRIGWKPRLSKKKKNWYRAFFHRLSIKGLDLMNDSDIQAKYQPKDINNFKQIIRGILTYVLTFEPGMSDYISEKLRSVSLE